MSTTQGGDQLTREKRQEDLLLASFRCAGKKDRFKLLKAALKAAKATAK